MSNIWWFKLLKCEKFAFPNLVLYIYVNIFGLSEIVFHIFLLFFLTKWIRKGIRQINNDLKLYIDLACVRIVLKRCQLDWKVCCCWAQITVRSCLVLGHSVCNSTTGCDVSITVASPFLLRNPQRSRNWMDLNSLTNGRSTRSSATNNRDGRLNTECEINNRSAANLRSLNIPSAIGRLTHTLTQNWW